MRRWVGRIVVCLMLGAVTTVAVAWGCALVSNAFPVTGYAVLSPSPALSLPDGFEVEPRDRRQRPLPPFLPPRPDADLNLSYGSAFGIDADEGTGLATVDPPLARGIVTGRRLRAGWPWRALTGEAWDITRTNAGTPEVERRKGLIRVLERPRMLGGSREWGAIPIRPEWTGFVLDTLFYGCLFLTPLIVRDVIRLRFGHCPACGYDLQHNLAAGCPECGWNRANEGNEASSGRGMMASSAERH